MRYPAVRIPETASGLFEGTAFAAPDCTKPQNTGISKPVVARSINQQDEPVSGTSTDNDAGQSADTTLRYTPSVWVEGQSSKDLQKLQLNDPDIGPILAAKLSDSRPKSQDMITKSPACRHYWIIWDVLVIKDRILLKKFFKKDGTGGYLQFLVPRAMKTNILFQMHNSLLSGHIGCKKTREKILQRFYWYELKQDVNLYNSKCDTCAADKKPLKTQRAPLGSLRTGAPGDCISTDYLGPFPITERKPVSSFFD